MDRRLVILPMEPQISGIPTTTRAFKGPHNHISTSTVGEEKNDIKIVFPRRRIGINGRETHETS